MNSVEEIKINDVTWDRIQAKWSPKEYLTQLRKPHGQDKREGTSKNKFPNSFFVASVVKGYNTVVWNFVYDVR